MKENRTLEFKEEITNAFLKTVSAYANYDGGTVLFGIADDGKITGIENPQQACLDIENRINDSITPQPDYTLSIQKENRIVALTVKGGINKPYLYKSKAYKRNDTATIEVDTLEFTRLVLEGKHMYYEELPSDTQELSFSTLGERLKNVTGIVDFDKDVLKTLNLYSDQNGFHNAAAILADKNEFPGIDIARFGENISIIQKRVTFDNMSIISAYEKSLEIYRDYYQYEKITGSVRENIEIIPEAAFREAIANALIHRLWDVKTQIRVSMFDDKIEIVSPGGLPTGISEKEYLAGRISVLRNPILANVLYRLKIVEIFGTGILRIMQNYEGSLRKPSVEVSDNMIKVVLPVMEMQPNLTADEKAIYRLLSSNISKSISEIMPYVEFGKTKVVKILKEMTERGIVKVEGTGRGTKYHL